MGVKLFLETFNNLDLLIRTQSIGLVKMKPIINYDFKL